MKWKEAVLEQYDQMIRQPSQVEKYFGLAILWKEKLTLYVRHNISTIFLTSQVYIQVQHTF